MMKTIYTLSILFVLFLSMVIYFADRGEMPQFLTRLYAFPNGDKVGHFLLMGGFSLCVNLVLRCRRMRVYGISLLIGSLIVSVVVVVEEFSQQFFSNRTFSFSDYFFSLLGIWVFGWLAERFWRKS
jgi:VanZ family protein